MSTATNAPVAAAAAEVLGLEKEFTYADVKNHSSKSDLYVVIHDGVYDTSKFVYEHPGGEEVILDYAGADATDAFEDVGHSDEARDVLKEIRIGKLKRMPGDPAPSAPPPGAAKLATTSSSSSGLGVGVYVLCIAAAAAAVYAWKFLAVKENKK